MTVTTLPPLAVEPVARPVMTQFWSDVVFLHWRYDADVVQARLPAGVQVDTFDGSAWIGLVPFRMERLAFGPLPPVPRLGTFPEVNVRTYVHTETRRGVWFFSLDIDLLLPMLVARSVYRLPYCTGEVSHDVVQGRVHTRVDRRRPRRPTATTDLRVALGDSVTADPFADWLTSRWGLLTSGIGDRLRYAPVDHPPWPLRHATAEHVDDQLIRAAGLPAPTGRPHGLYSPAYPRASGSRAASTPGEFGPQ